MDNKLDSYEKIKELLPHGAIKEIADKHNVTTRTVRYVFSNMKTTHPIFSSIIESAEKSLSIKKENQSRIQKLTA